MQKHSIGENERINVCGRKKISSREEIYFLTQRNFCRFRNFATKKRCYATPTNIGTLAVAEFAAVTLLLTLKIRNIIN